jgi:hypothetical protein
MGRSQALGACAAVQPGHAGKPQFINTHAATSKISRRL